MWKTKELTAPSQRSQQIVSKTEKSQRSNVCLLEGSRVSAMGFTHLSRGGGRIAQDRRLLLS